MPPTSPLPPNGRRREEETSREFTRGMPSDSPVWPRPSDAGVGGRGGGAGCPASEEAEEGGGRVVGAIGTQSLKGKSYGAHYRSVVEKRLPLRPRPLLTHVTLDVH